MLNSFVNKQKLIKLNVVDSVSGEGVPSLISNHKAISIRVLSTLLVMAFVF